MMMDGTLATSASIHAQKEKKRRNRQRLSCTECTKRRQKCDRQRPCGLCTTRGVVHLCRWESDYPRPMSNIQDPSPSVPNSQTPQLLGTIDQLKARIAALEDTLQRTTNQTHPSNLLLALPQPAPSFHALLPPSIPHTLSSTSISQLIPPSPQPHQTDNIYTAALTLTQASLVSGAGEYIGQGSIIGSMYKMSEGEIKFPYVQSTALYSRQPPHAQSMAISNMIQRLPQRNECDPIIMAFFTHHNWRFGVPETVFRRNYESMYHIVASQENIQVNPHWLGLLFSTLAYATNNPMAAPEYFYNAVTARRVAEDMLLAPAFTPLGERKLAASADGAALGCFAAVLQATYLADRGMVSEGWKLVGNALRSAIAIGMHRDPSWHTWLEMSEEEKLLRTRSWWSLVIFDRLHSYILGRPTSVRADQFDIRVPEWSKLGHCSYGMYEEALAKLSCVIDEAHRTCLGILAPSPATLNEVDDQFNKWESSLTIPFRWRLSATPEDLRSWGASYCASNSMPGGKPGIEFDPSSASNEFTILRQRHTLATWFLACRIILHRQFMVPYSRSGGVSSRNLGDGAPQLDVSTRAFNKQSENQCFDLCLELCTVQVAGHGVDSNLTHTGEPSSSRKVLPGKISGFIDSFFLFDCAVSLMLCLCSFAPGDSRARIAYDGVERAGNILSRLARTTSNDPQGDISRRAIAVLLVLKRYQEHLMKGVQAAMNSRTEQPQQSTAMEVNSPTQANLEGLPKGNVPTPSRNASSVSTPSSYERYSRYLDTTAAPRAAGVLESNNRADERGALPEFSFLDSFNFSEDPSAVLRECSSPTFDWGADWSAFSQQKSSF